MNCKTKPLTTLLPYLDNDESMKSFSPEIFRVIADFIERTRYRKSYVSGPTINCHLPLTKARGHFSPETWLGTKEDHRRMQCQSMRDGRGWVEIGRLCALSAAKADIRVLLTKAESGNGYLAARWKLLQSKRENWHMGFFPPRILIVFDKFCQRDFRFEENRFHLRIFRNALFSASLLMERTFLRLISFFT